MASWAQCSKHPPFLRILSYFEVDPLNHHKPLTLPEFWERILAVFSPLVNLSESLTCQIYSCCAWASVCSDMFMLLPEQSAKTGQRIVFLSSLLRLSSWEKTFRCYPYLCVICGYSPLWKSVIVLSTPHCWVDSPKSPIGSRPLAS